MEEGPSPIDRFLLTLPGAEKPRVCFIPTPSGDLPEHIDKFYAAFPKALCQPSHLAFFRKPSATSVPLDGMERHVLAQDIVYVGGGNTKSALSVWREWGLDDVLRRAYKDGTILSGMSAGAMCWFDGGLTDSFWGPELRPIKCLGILQGGCAVHYSSDPKRRSTLHAAIRAGTTGPSIAIDDSAAVLFSNGEIDQVLSWRDGSTAYRVTPSGGQASEVRCEAVRIP